MFSEVHTSSHASPLDTSSRQSSRHFQLLSYSITYSMHLFQTPPSCICTRYLLQAPQIRHLLQHFLYAPSQGIPSRYLLQASPLCISSDLAHPSGTYSIHLHSCTYSMNLHSGTYSMHLHSGTYSMHLLSDTYSMHLLSGAYSMYLLSGT